MRRCRINADGFLKAEGEATPVVGDDLHLRDALFVDVAPGTTDTLAMHLSLVG